MTARRNNTRPASGVPRKVRRDHRRKRPDSAALARPKKVSILGHGGRSASLLRDPLDLRTRVGKAYQLQRAAFRAHVGGEPSLPQEKLIDQAARLGLLADISWGALARAGTVLRGNGLHPAFEAFLKATRDQRAVLVLLGIQRQPREVPDLKTYLEQRGKQPLQQESHDAPQ